MDSMNRMRMQSSPRPASGRRVVAGKRTRPDETKNCVRKLLKREISRAGNLAFNRTNSQEKFWNFHLQTKKESLSRRDLEEAYFSPYAATGSSSSSCR
ncbi:unnamed protein product [Sphagnum jensenii]|uniref:Uncharacterized protein n=1 Tax=Sphagnum jensenii TaxID=128206 RepID=A0ABP0WGD5_9BRYO